MLYSSARSESCSRSSFAAPRRRPEKPNVTAMAMLLASAWAPPDAGGASCRSGWPLRSIAVIDHRAGDPAGHPTDVPAASIAACPSNEREADRCTKSRTIPTPRRQDAGSDDSYNAVSARPTVAGQHGMIPCCMLTFLLPRMFCATALALLAACVAAGTLPAELPISAGIGAHPTLPEPDSSLIPTIEMARAVGLAAGRDTDCGRGPQVAAYRPGPRASALAVRAAEWRCAGRRNQCAASVPTTARRHQGLVHARSLMAQGRRRRAERRPHHAAARRRR